MPRPSRQIDQVLLASGRALFPSAGCARLSVRALTEHAGVNQAMFHYHFKTKAVFLDTLLQQLYDEMFAALSTDVRSDGPALQRLEHALVTIAQHARENRRVLARVWIDALGGEQVALDFFRRNAPRHVGVLTGLLEQAEREGSVRTIPPLQRFVFMMGSVLMPIVFAAEVFEAAPELKKLRGAFESQVLSDAAIAERVGLALAAIGVAATPQPRARRGDRA
jgi:AcrR family transcriptional regulator